MQTDLLPLAVVALGSALVAGFALKDGLTTSPTGDMLMLAAAILACGLGYAEGARLSRRLGGWQVISWELVLSLPVMVVLALATVPPTLETAGGPAWLGLA